MEPLKWKLLQKIHGSGKTRCCRPGPMQSPTIEKGDYCNMELCLPKATIAAPHYRAGSDKIAEGKAGF